MTKTAVFIVGPDSTVKEEATNVLNPHDHSFTYSLSDDNATITAKCTANGCTLPPSTQGGIDHVSTLTITAPTLTTYSGMGDAAATLTGREAFNTATGKSIAATEIKYVGRNNTTYAESASAPTGAGDYTAKITVEGKTASVEYTIAPIPVTVSGITASDKTYDGKTDATLVTTNASFIGKLDADTLTVTAAGTFDNANVGENKTVTISELTLGGDSKDNYSLASDGQQTSATAKITAKEVGLTWSNTELAYTGQSQKPTATATGLVERDTCTVTVTGEQTEVGDNYTATASSLSNSNYVLPENKTTSFKISKADAVAATVTANNRTYYVWYKAVGDENHVDSEVSHVEVTIEKKTLTITADAKEKTAGSDDPAFTYTVEGLVEGDKEEDVLTGVVSRTNGEEAGEYEIIQGTLDIAEAYAGCYALDFTGASFIIHAVTQDEEPTDAPTNEPDASTNEPTSAPTSEPATAPTSEPAAAPTSEPATAPTSEPATASTSEPATAPTSEPTAAPTTAPATTAKEKAALFLNAGLKVIHKGKTATVEWGKVSGAAYYKVYAGYCGSTYELAKKATAGKKCKITIKKLKGKKLSTKKNIKVYVAAYKVVNGKEVQMAKSIDGHVVGKENVEYSNAMEIRISKTSYTLKKGKSVTVNAKTVLQYPKRSQLSDAHAKAPKVR